MLRLLLYDDSPLLLLIAPLMLGIYCRATTGVIEIGAHPRKRATGGRLLTDAASYTSRAVSTYSIPATGGMTSSWKGSAPAAD